MFLYEKKVVYLSEYQDGAKGRNAGFVKLLREKDVCILDIHIRYGLPDGYYMLSLVMKNKEVTWESLPIQNGNSAIQRQIKLRHNRICIGAKEYEENEFQGILLRLNEKCCIAGYFTEPDSLPVKSDEIIKEIKAVEKEVEAETEIEETISEDKWEQLQKCYQNVHPFGDQRLFLSIEPKDFIILQASFQKLVNNSFLLHGFYNYRHLILGPDKNLSSGTGRQFYLGVPGTYFEREKMVAIMFGFEGFECEGAVEIGKFGYYMRRVEL